MSPKIIKRGIFFQPGKFINFIINIIFFRLQDLKTRLLNAEDFGGETFLSEIIAINILQEVKNAFIRCTTVYFLLII
jgi:hypothetical protein